MSVAIDPLADCLLLGENSEIFVAPKPRQPLDNQQANYHFMRCIPLELLPDLTSKHFPLCFANCKSFTANGLVKIRRLRVHAPEARKRTDSAESNQEIPRYPTAIYTKIQHSELVPIGSIAVPKFLMDAGGFEAFDNAW